jgi:hypothetical protein
LRTFSALLVLRALLPPGYFLTIFKNNNYHKDIEEAFIRAAQKKAIETPCRPTKQKPPIRQPVSTLIVIPTHPSS